MLTKAWLVYVQMMIWAVGLRGAVAYGLALNLPQIEGESDEGIPAIESATLVIVVLSTLILGSATGPLLRHFDLQVGYVGRCPPVSVTCRCTREEACIAWSMQSICHSDKCRCLQLCQSMRGFAAVCGLKPFWGKQGPAC